MAAMALRTGISPTGPLAHQTVGNTNSCLDQDPSHSGRAHSLALARVSPPVQALAPALTLPPALARARTLTLSPTRPLALAEARARAGALAWVPTKKLARASASFCVGGASPGGRCASNVVAAAAVDLRREGTCKSRFGCNRPVVTAPALKPRRGGASQMRRGAKTVVAAAAVDAGYMAVGSGHSGPAVLAVLCATAAAAQVLADRTEIGARVSAPLLAIVIGSCLAAFRILPSASVHTAAYDVIWEHLMPLAVSFSLLETDVSQVHKTAGRSFGAFLLGALTTVIGTVLAFLAVGKWMGPDGWKVASCFCASYIGGSINYAATAQGLGFGASAGSRSLLAAGMSVDNLLMAAFFSALAALPAHWGALLPPRAPTHSGSGDSTAIPAHSSTGNSGKGSTEGSEGASTGTSAGSSTEGSAAGNFEKGRVASEVVEEGREESGTGHESGEGQASSVPPVGPPPSRAVTVETLTVSIAAATAAFAVSGAICAHQAGTKTARPQVAVIAFLSSLLGVALPKLGLALRHLQIHIRTLLTPSQPLPQGDWAPAPPSALEPICPLFSGSSLLSSALLLIFFATIGATANVHDALAAGGPLFAFVSILLTVHLSVLLALGKVLNLPLDVLLVASNANVGGPATAAAMATSRGWTHLVQPAILTGTFGYAIGTPLGFFVASKVLKPLAQHVVPGL